MYRASGPDRSYVCPRCSMVGRAPLQGGPAACARCQTTTQLPDRSAILAPRGPMPMPSNDPGWLAQLRVQDGRPRLTTPTLQAVLGGDAIQPGREQEAIAIWQSLRSRAAQGDIAASEDLSLLTLMIAQLDSMKAQPDFSEALSESALDVVVLPRHRQEQLGRLVRLAAARGDRARAAGLMGLMTPNAQELDADSEFRLAHAVIGAIDRDGNRMLQVLGPQKDAVPIVDSMDGLASVFRAHAYELVGNPTVAAQILRELPDPRVLQLVRERFPALQLCAQSAAVYTQATSQEAAQRAGAAAGGIALLFGAIFGFTGFVTLVIGVCIAIFSDEDGLVGGAITGVLGLAFLIGGVLAILGGRAKAKRASYLRLHGLSLTARIVNAGRTGTEINDVPVMRFELQVQGPQGPYAASFTKLVPEHQVAMLVGREVRVRADPRNLAEVILEE